MTAKQFFSFINQIAPKEGEYPDRIRLNLSLFNLYKNNFNFQLKSKIWLEAKEPFRELYLNVDLTRKCTHDFCYLSYIQENDDYLKIGEGDSVDYLVEKSTGEVIMLWAYNQDMEDYDEDHIVSYVAASQEHFLDALSIMYELDKLRILKEYTIDDTDISRPYIERCVIAAGGEKYKKYYDK